MSLRTTAELKLWQLGEHAGGPNTRKIVEVNAHPEVLSSSCQQLFLCGVHKRLSRGQLSHSRYLFAPPSLIGSFLKAARALSSRSQTYACEVQARAALHSTQLVISKQLSTSHTAPGHLTHHTHLHPFCSETLTSQPSASRQAPESLRHFDFTLSSSSFLSFVGRRSDVPSSSIFRHSLCLTCSLITFYEF